LSCAQVNVNGPLTETRRSATHSATMPLRYQLRAAVSGEHTQAINQVAFSPNGRYMASASDDGRLIVWLVEEARRVYLFASNAAILSLCWLADSCGLICGSHDGTLIQILLKEDEIIGIGIMAHSCPIEQLAVSHECRHLASGAHHEAKIWTPCCTISQGQGCDPANENHVSSWKEAQVLPDPPLNPFNHGSDILITALSWPEGSSDVSLMAGYMNHGVVCWAINTLTPLWTVAHPSCGAASLCAERSLLAVADLCNQFSVFDIGTGACVSTFHTEGNGWSMVLPVQFVHGGLGLLTGSTNGTVSIWDLLSARKLQTLHHPDITIQALTAFYDEENDTFQIVSGSGTDSSGDIFFWRAETVEVGEQDSIELQYQEDPSNNLSRSLTDSDTHNSKCTIS